MTIFDCKVGEQVSLLKIELSGAMALRLRALGFCTGSKVFVLAFSFFKSSVLVGCGNVRLGIRKRLAEQIFVVPCESFKTENKVLEVPL